jgi:uncharacterized membrane protein
MIPRRHDISRLEAFSDAVFGFALALLVVSAEPPASYAELMDRMAGGVSFACCFALPVWIWYEHNALFRRYGLHDGYGHGTRARDLRHALGQPAESARNAAR